MALTDLSLVSQSLLGILRNRVDAGMLQIYGAAQMVNYSLLPSDEEHQDATLNLYLYHVTEDAALKNQAPVSSSLETSPARYNPMGLQLYYQLTVHEKPQNTEGDQGLAAMQRVQQIFGLAIKALHDYARIDSSTPNTQLHDNNYVRVSMLHVTPEQAEQFWTSTGKPVRLAAYYMVTAVLLEPEMPTLIAGRVLKYSVQTFLNRGPHLDASHNTVTIQPQGGLPPTIEFRPAEVAINDSFVLDGNGLTADSTALLIRRLDWNDPIDASAWVLSAGSNSVTAKALSPVNVNSQPVLILPGYYAAVVQVTGHRLLSDGTTSIYSLRSNEAGIAIVPTIQGPIFGGVAISKLDDVPVVGGPFQHVDALTGNTVFETVQVVIAGTSLPKLPITNPVTPLAGHFEILSATSLHFQLPADWTLTGVVPFAIIVNGAESAPRWITLA